MPRKAIVKKAKSLAISPRLNEALTTPAHMLTSRQAELILAAQRRGILDANHDMAQSAMGMRFKLYFEKKAKK